MFVRKTIAGVVAVTLAGSVVALSAGAASAVYRSDPDDTTFTAVSADLIGVGSDTSQHALKLLADRWNADSSHTFRIATYAATEGGAAQATDGSATIPLPSGDIKRPNGSGEGKGRLYGASNNTDVDFARSSSALNATEVSAQLQAFPFALDTLVMAVSNSTPSNAPATLTPAQIVSIYKGDTTNWNQIGGQDGVIAPKIPQPNSGTRNFFVAQLKAMNGGVDVVLGQNVAEVQEHDDSLIKNNANAIAPFSKGRASLLGNTLRLEQGWSADRALYNVVRGTDVGNADILSVFGTDGFVCSNDARASIEAAGFEQLATPAHGGVCGAPTQSATTNFATNQQIVTTTSLKATCPRAYAAKLVATVTGSTSPQGTVDFLEGATVLAGDVPMVSGAATVTVKALPMGDHTFTAVFKPSADNFETSQDDASVLVKTSSTVSESFPARVARGDRARGTVTVLGDGAKASGTVKVMKGTKTLVSGTLSRGQVTFTLPKLPVGDNKLKAVYGGDADVAGSAKSFTITQR